MTFTRLQKVAVWMLVVGAFFLGIALGEWLIERVLDLRYSDSPRLVFGLFGAAIMASVIVLRILTEPKEP